MGRVGVCPRHVCHRHGQTVDLGAVEILPFRGVRVQRSRHRHHPASAHLGAYQRRDRELQATDVRQEAVRCVQDAQSAQPVDRRHQDVIGMGLASAGDVMSVRSDPCFLEANRPRRGEGDDGSETSAAATGATRGLGAR